MKRVLSRQFQPPRFDDEEQTRIAQIQHLLLLICLAIALSASGINALLGRSISTIALLASSSVACIALLLLYVRRLRLSIIVLLSLFIALTASLQFIGRGAHDTVTSLYATVIVIGSLLLDRHAFIAMVAVILLVIAGIVTAEMYGWTRSPYDGEPGDWLDLALILGLTAFASRLLSESLQHSRALARKNAEALEAQTAALRASEERYRILAANLPDSAVLIFDHDLRFVLADGPELAATGYSKEGLEGRVLYEAVPPSFAAQVEGNIRAVLSGKRFSAEIPYEDRIYHYHYVPLIDDGGRVKYAMILARNVTEQRRAQAALREREAQLRMITENMGDAITQLDANLTIVYASPSVQRVFGRIPAELGGAHVSALIHPDDASDVIRRLERMRDEGASAVRVEYRGPGSQGVWLESEIRPLYTTHQQFTGAIITTRDITERKQIEAERERLIAELEQKNAELERFTYTASHDLRSPLITIQGFLGYLERDLEEGNTERTRSDIRRISAAVQKMERLLSDLLELSRIGRLSAPPQEVAFNAIVQDALDLLAGKIAERQAHISIAPDMPVVYGDRGRLVEVIQNLVDNALKFCDNQKEPVIEIGVTKESSGSPVFFVRDNGIGIDPKYHEQIFGLFNKLDPRSEGTGVGLTIVRRIIEVHGGRIWVESTGPGAGATFYFTLPVVATPVQEASHGRRDAQSASG
ncbi:MAG: PAS domain S-box protein [Roseiflexus sp.]|nr:PAS domain S-box protein [Roseiflexus sp.]MCS7289284.1 PAS domain S-box protein [Roseiflexus sp.]MDW8232486.1 PAS domain S-box protein [Roseiflexaceae bacterium]